MSNRFGVILASLVIIFAGVFFINKNKADAPIDANGNPTSAQPSNHVIGDNAKKVSFVEYADFQCPACAQYYPLVKQVVEQRKADISFQFVNFPLTSIHQNALAAHRAAEAADKQGKFWEMYDTLYTNHDAWQSSTTASSAFEGYAQELGLNMDQYRKDVASSEVNDIINADLAKGRKLNIGATPTFYINDKEVTSSPQSVDDFNKLIDDAISVGPAQQ